MKTLRFFFTGMVLFVMLAAISCTTPKYDNPVDKNGDAYVPGDPCAEDNDGDGIANMYDPDGPPECHVKSQPKITLVGDSVIVIPLNDPLGVVAGLKGMVHATDPTYGNLDSAIIVTGEVFTTQCGTFTLTYTVSNIANVKDQKKRLVIVDCAGPVITLNGNNPMNINLNAPYVEPGATAFDSVSGVAQVTISKAPVTAVEHEDSVIYTAVDAIGNKSYAKRLVIISKLHINDSIPPVITLIGNSEMTLKIGVGAYNEPGWTVTDNVDTDLHDKVKVDGSVNVGKIGTYTLYYNVSDNAGNAAESKARIVHITPSDTGPDITKPEITLRGKTMDTVQVGKTWKEPGYMVWDDRDTVGLGDSVKVTGGPVTTTAATFFRLQYTVKDKAGNTSLVNQRIVVVSATVTGDTIPPVLKMDGKPRDTTAVGVRYTDPGATATDIGPGGATTNLNASIVRTVTNASSATVQFDQFYKTIGSYSITYSVKDAAGNPAKDVSRSVYVKDTSATPPDSLFARYGVPLTSALATINHTFKDTPFVVDGPAALVPKMKSVKEFVLNWDLTNKQVNQFSLGLTSGSFMNFTVGGSTNKLTHTFAGDKPTFSITGSGISKLDGEYYIVATTKQCVWVRTDGSFAIIFK